MKWISFAEWPKGSIVQRRANDITTDSHLTEPAAKAVCRMLERDGLGGEGKIFPLRTWVELCPAEEDATVQKERKAAV